MHFCCQSWRILTCALFQLACEFWVIIAFHVQARLVLQLEAMDRALRQLFILDEGTGEGGGGGGGGGGG